MPQAKSTDREISRWLSELFKSKGFLLCGEPDVRQIGPAPSFGDLEHPRWEVEIDIKRNRSNVDPVADAFGLVTEEMADLVNTGTAQTAPLGGTPRLSTGVVTVRYTLTG